MVFYQQAVGNERRRLTKFGENFGASRRQTLTGSDIKRHAFPAPGIDFYLHSSESFCLRIFGDTVFLEVTEELAAHQVLVFNGWNRSQNLYFFVAKRFAIRAYRGLHCKIAQDLKQVVLHHVADSAGLIVKTAAALYAEILGHGDLDALDVVAVPERLDKSVGKAEGEHVVNRALAEIVVNTKDVVLVESPKQNFIEFLCRCEIMP